MQMRGELAVKGSRRVQMESSFSIRTKAPDRMTIQLSAISYPLEMHLRSSPQTWRLWGKRSTRRSRGKRSRDMSCLNGRIKLRQHISMLPFSRNKCNRAWRTRKSRCKRTCERGNSREPNCWKNAKRGLRSSYIRTPGTLVLALRPSTWAARYDQQWDRQM